jgi:predicted ATPase with chaperone activity
MSHSIARDAGLSRVAYNLENLIFVGDEPVRSARDHAHPSHRGRIDARTAVVTTHPFRAPPQTFSNARLNGGGQVPRPGDVSQARHGVLLLDELPEFRRNVLEVLRQPLEMSITRIHSRERAGSQCFWSLSCG